MTGSELIHLRNENLQLRKENERLRAENNRFRQKLKELGHPVALDDERSISDSVEPPFPVVRKFPPKESIDIQVPVNDIAPNTKRRSWVNGKIVYDFEQAHDFDPPKPHPKLQAAAPPTKPKRKIVAKAAYRASLDHDNRKPPPPSKQLGRKSPFPRPPMPNAKKTPLAAKPKSLPSKVVKFPPKPKYGGNAPPPIPVIPKHTPTSSQCVGSPDFEEPKADAGGWKNLPPTFSKFSVDSTDSFHKIDLYDSRTGEGSTDSGIGIPAPPKKPKSMMNKRPPPTKHPKPPSRKSMPPTRSTPKPKQSPPTPPPQKQGFMKKSKTAPPRPSVGKKPPPLKKKPFHPPPRPSPTGNVSKSTPAPATSPNEFYSLEQLQTKSIPGLDYSDRTKYLSCKDFQEHFGMSREAFSELKQWKKTQVLKKLKLW